jgi:hypothetical protein
MKSDMVYYHEADAKFCEKPSQVKLSAGRIPPVDRPDVFRICYEGGQIIGCLSKH